MNQYHIAITMLLLAPLVAAAASPSDCDIRIWATHARAMIQEHVRYPKAAHIHNQEGDGAVETTIKADGSVGGLIIIKSTGLSTLDQAMVDAIMKTKIAPLPCADVGQVQLGVPFFFRLNQLGAKPDVDFEPLVITPEIPDSSNQATTGASE